MAVSKARYMARRIGILAVLGFAITGFISGQMAGASSSKATNLTHYSVHGGETLWQIAKKESPSSDPRDYVAELVDLNQLKSATLVPGQDLLLPNH